MSSYTGGRIVPKHCGVWSSVNEYEMLSIVLYGSTGDSYMARKAVPKGVDITDTEYWAFCADYSAQLSMIASDVDSLETDLKTLQAQVAENVTASTDADADYAAEVVDARVDSEGNAYDSLGENIRSITSSLTPKIAPLDTGVAVTSTSGNTGTIEVKGRTLKADYSYNGTSYVGLFAGFFGTYADVSDKTIRVVMWCNVETSFEVIITNARTAWGSTDGSTTSLSIGTAKFTEDNHYRAVIDIDFSSEKIADFAAGLTEGHETLYFCLRKTGTTESEGTVYFYAYELDDRRDLLWKYVTLYDDILLLQDEIENARNDGTEYSTLKEVFLAHRADIDAITQEVEDARTDSYGFTAGSLAERLASMDTVVRPRIPIDAIYRPRDNSNGWLDNIEGAQMGAEIIRNNARFYFDYETYLASVTPAWGSVHFSFCATNAYVSSLDDISKLYLSFKIEGLDDTKELHTGESMTIMYYVNGYSAWANKINPMTTTTVTIGSTTMIEIPEEYVQNIIDAGTPLFILFYGTFLNCDAVADMGQVQITASIVNKAVESELSAYTGYSEYAESAAVADKAAESEHASEADYAEKAGAVESADYAKDAGYSTRDVYGLANASKCTVSSLTKDSNKVTVVYTPVSTDSPNQTTFLWNYWLATINILDMFGKGAKFIISGTNTGGACGPAFYKITATPTSWAKTLKSVYVNLSEAEEFSFEVDLDSLGIDTSGYEDLYLLVGYESRITTTDEDGNYVFDHEGEINLKAVYTDNEHTVIATELVGFNQDDYYKAEEVDEKLSDVAAQVGDITSIVCWGDSLTAGGGWTTTLQTLSGLTVYNGGTGGENARTIMARQGGDVMMINNITIPAECEAVTIATRADDTGITTQFGNKVTPLLQGGAHVNPVMIGDIEGTLTWTGSNYADTTGTWTFTRSEAGDEVEITRPTAIRTNFDRIHNGKDTIMIIFMGQNGGYSDVDDLINMHKLMIDHFKGKEYIILGLSSGTASSRASYEAAMQEAFGRRFISLREYLSTALYDEDGDIISCYGLDDQDLEMEETHTYGSTTYVTVDEIEAGTVPHQILSDSVHYTSGTKTVIGNLIYKRMVELEILEQG